MAIPKNNVVVLQREIQKRARSNLLDMMLGLESEIAERVERLLSSPDLKQETADLEKFVHATMDLEHAIYELYGSIRALR